MDILRWGPFELDPGRRQLRRGGVVVDLQPLPFDVLHLLAQRMDEAVSRDELLATAWGGARVVDGALTQVVRKLRAALGDDPDEPRWLRTVPRFGYRLAGGGGVSTLPAALVGRADELGWLRAAVAGGARAITVHATGGSGKSSLVRAWLAEVGGVVVPCGEVATAEALAVRLAEATGAEAPDLARLPAAVDRALGERRALLLDDADRLDADAVTLATACARDRVRVHTSRAPLGVPGEVCLPLGGLSEEIGATWLATLTPAGWADDATRRALVAAVGGSPLALELLAARAPEVAADVLLARLGGDGALDALPGDGLLRCLRLTWALLPAEGRRALAAISCFAGPFDADDAAAAVGVSAPALDALRARRLLRGPPEAASLLGPERAFARERLRESPDADALVAGWRRWAVGSGRWAELAVVAADPTHPDAASGALLALFEAWQGGVGHALLDRWAAALEGAAGPRPEVHLVRAMVATGRDLDEARRRCRALCEAPDPDLAARGWLGLAGLTTITHDPAGARDAAARAVALATRPRTRTRAATMAAMVAVREGRAADALATLLDAVDLETDDRTRAGWLSALASARRALGDGAGAEAALREALGLEPPDGRVGAGLRANLGGLLAERGGFGEAAPLLAAAREVFASDGDRRGESETGYGLALVHFAEGRLDEVDRALRRVVAIEKDLGSPFGRQRAQVLQAALALARGARAEAVVLADRAAEGADPEHAEAARAVAAVARGAAGGVAGDGPWARAARGETAALGPSAVATVARRVLAGG